MGWEFAGDGPGVRPRCYFIMNCRDGRFNRRRARPKDEPRPDDLPGRRRVRPGDALRPDDLPGRHRVRPGDALRPDDLPGRHRVRQEDERLQRGRQRPTARRSPGETHAVPCFRSPPSGVAARRHPLPRHSAQIPGISPPTTGVAAERGPGREPGDFVNNQLSIS